MNNNASGSLLAQYSAADALANVVFTAPASLQVEVTRVIICNTSASPVAASLFHDDTGGAGLGTANALLFAKAIPANDYLDLRIEGVNGGLHVSKGGRLGFTDASSGDLTISIYGITQQAVQGQR